MSIKQQGGDEKLMKQTLRLYIDAFEDKMVLLNDD